MKKGKYIDYNILLACLSKKPQAAAESVAKEFGTRNIVEEFYEALAIPVVTRTAGLPGWRSTQIAEPACCS